jgi:hypothetical protein
MKRLLFISLASLCATAAHSDEVDRYLATALAALPAGMLKTYCAAAVDSPPAVFSPRNAPAIEWRCVHGVAYACLAGADGVACSARSHSRVPLPSMLESCRDYGSLPVASGAFGFVWRWECQNGAPVIVGPALVWGGKATKFDDQGYAEEEWKGLR